MAYGVKVWRADGKLQVTSEAGISRIVAQYFKPMVGQSAIDGGTAGGAVQSYTQPVTGMAADGRWAVLTSGPSDGTPSNTADLVRITINSGSFTATVPDYYAQYNGYWGGVFYVGYPATFTVIAL
jgi:hypothetical protein